MQKFKPLIIIVLLILVLSSCASSENSIISISLGGAVLVEDVEINETERTITATVETIDISKIVPKLELSSNASVGELKLTDGEACTCIVTAEDGTISDWTITVTVLPGITFKYDEIAKTFINGVVGEDYGDGVPSLSVCTTGQSGNIGLAFSADYDPANSDLSDIECLFLNLSNTSDEPISGLSWSVSSTKSVMAYIASSAVVFGEVGDLVAGTFFGSGYEYVDDVMNPDSIDITEGYYKLMRIADDSGTMYLY